MRSRRAIAGGTLTLAVMLGAAACSGDHSGNHIDGAMDAHGAGMHESSVVVEGAREIEVSATSFAFDPDELTLAAGEDVTIALTSDDVFHDFEIEGADGHVGAGAGKTRRGGFRVDEPGTYTFFCTVSGHRAAGMKGVVVVT